MSGRGNPPGGAANPLQVHVPAGIRTHDPLPAEAQEGLLRGPFRAVDETLRSEIAGLHRAVALRTVHGRLSAESVMDLPPSAGLRLIGPRGGLWRRGARAA